ncbi:type VII secretion system-associated protein [Streptomyces sp. NPDC006923]|uniref:type VII secretion system-associated protein n=1 Tax=Streptomyces sp. NPDC006923 TaxID=3155355 RepID=UPI0033DDF51D
MADLTKLDAPALRAFIDEDVHKFKTDIVTLRTTSEDRKSLYDLATTTLPLVIGPMSEDGDSGGKNVVTNIVTAAKAIDGVLNRHSTAIDDLERNLRNVVTTMLKTQGDNLAAVDGQKFLTAIADYNGDMGGGKSNTIPPPTAG